jgi:alpha-tubulin suppressor-like RCC1 family protein
MSCALTSRGEAYCWGNNGFGEVGDGTTTNRHSPTAVSGGFTFTSISAGGNQHVCGLTDRLGAWCWGYGLSGELGNGAFVSVSAPTAVQAP